MKPIVLDIETYYDTDVTLKKMTIEEYVGVAEPIMLGYHEVGDPEPPKVFDLGVPPKQVSEWLTEELRLQDRIGVMFNAAFDGSYIARRYGVRPSMFMDVQAMARAVVRPYTGSQSLAAVASYLGCDEKTDELASYKGRTRESLSEEDYGALASYCANDVRITEQALLKLVKRFSATDLKLMDIFTRMFVNPTLELDPDPLRAALITYQWELEDTLAKAGVDDIAVLRSRSGFVRLIEEITGEHIPTKVSPRTGKEIPAIAKTDPQFIHMRDNHPSTIVRNLCHARLVASSSIRDTRMGRFVGIADRGIKEYGRALLPVPISYYGAHTGRGAGYDKINMQNLPKGDALRNCIKAPPGKHLIVADFSQIEARLNAAFSGQTDLLELFRDPDGDPYCAMASKIFRRPINKEEHPKERFIGKTAVLGLGYGMGAEKFYASIVTQVPDVDLAFCTEATNVYRESMHYIVKNWRTADRCIKHMMLINPNNEPWSWGPLIVRHEKLELPNGMMLRYPELTDVGDNGDRDVRYNGFASGRRTWKRLWGSVLVENVMQALANIIIGNAMVRLDAMPGVTVVMQVHDEVVLVCDTPETEAIEAAMTQTVPWMPELPLEVEINVGESYGSCK